jgi:hypothetical protein
MHNAVEIEDRCSSKEFERGKRPCVVWKDAPESECRKQESDTVKHTSGRSSPYSRQESGVTQVSLQ